MDTTGRRRPLVRGAIFAVCLLVPAVLGALLVTSLLRDDPAPAPEPAIRLTPLDKNASPLVEGNQAGTALPSSSFPLLGGGTRSLTAYRGTPLVVNFFASWCGPCRREMADIEKVQRALGGRVRVLGLAVRDRAADAAAIVSETGATYEIGRDPGGKLFAELGGINVPSTFLVSKGGTVVGARAGALSEKELRALIAEELGVS